MSPTSKTDAARRARTVIEIEADGLRALAEGLVGEAAEAFEHAVDLIVACERYLVVAGVGKSGHIGQKLSASFASTGTPSFFMHPTEASHGDLGMLVPGCVVLAISNSGETSELAAILAYSRRAKIPVIAITRRADSSLGRGSDVVLQLPEREEACVNRLAPTTSTTMTLALGDALFVSVMERRGFTPSDFGLRHPGGKLGRRLQTVAEWLAAHPHDVPKVAPDASAQEVILSITEGRNGCTAVVDDKDFVGIVTDGDLRRAMTPDFFDRRASDLMTKGGVTLDQSMTMEQVAETLISGRISVAFVIENGKPIGLIDSKTLAEQGYL